MSDNIVGRGTFLQTNYGKKPFGIRNDFIFDSKGKQNKQNVMYCL